MINCNYLNYLKQTIPEEAMEEIFKEKQRQEVLNYLGALLNTNKNCFENYYLQQVIKFVKKAPLVDLENIK